MDNIDITRMYFILGVNERGTIEPIGTIRTRAYMIAIGILELLNDDILVLSDNKVCVNKCLPSNKKYLSPIYDWIVKSKEIEVRNLVRNMVVERDIFKALFESIGNSLIDIKLITKDDYGVIFKSNCYIPNLEIKNQIIKKIRTNLLQECIVTKEIIMLSSILNTSHILKNYFSKFEKITLNNKLIALRSEPKNRGIFSIIDNICGTITTVVVSAS